MGNLKINLSVLMGQKKIMSIRQLSEKTGISRQVLTRLFNEDWKDFRPSVKVLIKLCDFFECRLDELIEYDPRNKAS